MATGNLAWPDYWDVAKRVAREVQGDDREDVEQEVFLALWEARPADKALAYTIGKRQRTDYYRYMSHRRHDKLTEEMAMTTIEDHVMNRLTLQSIPAAILRINLKRLADISLSNRERQCLYAFRHRPA